jgi:hypothetical protein
VSSEKSGKFEIMRFAALADQILRWLILISDSVLPFDLRFDTCNEAQTDRNFGFPLPSGRRKSKLVGQFGIKVSAKKQVEILGNLPIAVANLTD